MPNNLALVVTNPLHYTYFRQAYNIKAIGSSRGLVANYGQELGFSENLSLFNVLNTPEALIGAHQKNSSEETSYITWRAAKVNARLLGNSYELAHQLERKAMLRRLLPPSLFPKFTVVAANQIPKVKFNHLSELVDAQKLVLQIDFSTGGKGTFFVESQSQLDEAVPLLKESDQDIVVSQYIGGVARGLQCLALPDRVIAAPWWHKDLVGIKGVCNFSEPKATRYCGAIIDNLSLTYAEKVQELVNIVGSKLLELGYYGVFGMDVVVDEQNQRVYLIEINPRFTAVSHTYATLMRASGYKTDFLTAQVSGVATDNIEGIDSLQEKRLLKSSYFYLKFQNMSHKTAILKSNCRLGIHDTNGQYLRFGFGANEIEDRNETAVIPEVSQGFIISPGGRTFSLIGTGEPVINGSLVAHYADYFDSLQRQFIAS